jgi:ribosome-binding ATPase YchF (GTP1/OBG family)
MGALKSQMKSGKTRTLEEQLSVYEKIYATLEEGKPANKLELSDEEKEMVRDLHLLTTKPFLYVLNVDEASDLEDTSFIEVEKKLVGYPIVKLCAQQEADMAELSDDEIQELGMKRTGLDVFIAAAYKLLNLITFLTTGPDETRAWTIVQGTKAPQAAGVIHTDFEKGFIRAEVVNWKDLLDAGGELAAKEKGLIRSEGKEYVMKDGDVCLFRFNP